MASLSIKPLTSLSAVNKSDINSPELLVPRRCPFAASYSIRKACCNSISMSNASKFTNGKVVCEAVSMEPQTEIEGLNIAEDVTQIKTEKRMRMSCLHAQCSHFNMLKELPVSSSLFLAMPQNTGALPANTKSQRQLPISLAALSMKDSRGNIEQGFDSTASTSDEGASGILNEKASKGSGTTARGRRLLKVREEKRKREYDRLHNYPSWAKVLEDACKNDSELRAVLGDSIGNPELMRKRVEDRVRKKGSDLQKSKSGSVLAFKVSFRDFNPLDSYVWFELYGSPSDRDVDLLGSVIQSWYLMGRLGAFNSANLQLANSSMEYDPIYDADKGSKVMPSSFHDISDVEFQDNWGRVWVDLGTADFFSIDVLLNCLTVLSSEYLGIQQVVFGGRRMGDWEDGMTSHEYGYKYFKI